MRGKTDRGQFVTFLLSRTTLFPVFAGGRFILERGIPTVGAVAELPAGCFLFRLGPSQCQRRHVDLVPPNRDGLRLLAAGGFALDSQFQLVQAQKGSRLAPCGWPEPSTVVRPSDGIGGLLGSGAAGNFGRRCAAAEVRVPVAAGQVHPPGSLQIGNDVKKICRQQARVSSSTRSCRATSGEAVRLNASSRDQ